jgi:hypothetical protein
MSSCLTRLHRIVCGRDATRKLRKKRLPEHPSHSVGEISDDDVLEYACSGVQVDALRDILNR